MYHARCRGHRLNGQASTDVAACHRMTRCATCRRRTRPASKTPYRLRRVGLSERSTSPRTATSALSSNHTRRTPSSWSTPMSFHGPRLLAARRHQEGEGAVARPSLDSRRQYLLVGVWTLDTMETDALLRRFKDG